MQVVAEAEKARREAENYVQHVALALDQNKAQVKVLFVETQL